VSVLIREFEIETGKRNEFVNITEMVSAAVKESKVKEGICIVFGPSTTAGITINEKADPNVAQDIINSFDELVPADKGYGHIEGNADSHIKTSIVGPSKILLVKDGVLLLGPWQAVFLCEFDGPRKRNFFVKVIKC
jgi:secondary thiamine-phosphate synthase enzyme